MGLVDRALGRGRSHTRPLGDIQDIGHVTIITKSGLDKSAFDIYSYGHETISSQKRKVLSLLDVLFAKNGHVTISSGTIHQS